MLSAKEKFIIVLNDDKLKISDAIIILEGDGPNRIAKGCELFNEGWASHLVFSGGIKDHAYGSYPFEELKEEFIKNNVDPHKVIVEGNSRHTKEQAENILQLCAENGWTKIILVASPYHQYRAWLTFLQTLIKKELERTIQIISGPASGIDWFKAETWGIRFNLLDEEFDKIAEYNEKGDVAGYVAALNYLKWKELQ